MKISTFGNSVTLDSIADVTFFSPSLSVVNKVSSVFNYCDKIKLKGI